MEARSNGDYTLDDMPGLTHFVGTVGGAPTCQRKRILGINGCSSPEDVGKFWRNLLTDSGNYGMYIISMQRLSSGHFASSASIWQEKIT